MQAVSFPARQSRTLYRHELRTVAYVILEEANGGIVRNLSPQGVGVQAVAALHEKQRVRVRFELRHPRLRVDSQGEVAWADSSGQCGIRFMGLPTQAARHIKEWIFGNLLDSIFRDAAQDRPVLRAAHPTPQEEDDGLILSAASRPVIQLEPARARPEAQPALSHRGSAQEEAHGKGLAGEAEAELDWLSRPLSGHSLAWLIDGLVIVAALLLFTLIFLSIAHEIPKWPLTLAGAIGSAIFVAAGYRMMFWLFGGETLGARMAQIAGSATEDDAKINGEVRLR